VLGGFLGERDRFPGNPPQPLTPAGTNLRTARGESTGQHLPFGSVRGTDTRCTGSRNEVKRLGWGDLEATV